MVMIPGRVNLGITNYRVYAYRVDTGAYLAYIETGSSTRQATVPNLLPGRDYTFQISGYTGELRDVADACTVHGTGDGFGNMTTVPSLFMRTLPIRPEPPTNVRVDTPQGKQLTVEWDPGFSNGANVTNYTLYNNASESARTVSADGLLAATFPNLIPATIYAFEMSASNPLGESDRVLYTFKTDLFVPEMLTANEFSALPPITDSSITVEWTAPRNNGLLISAYEIKFRCTTSLGCPQAVCPPSAGTSCQPGGTGLVLNNAICSGPSDADGNPTGPCLTTSFTHGPNLLQATQYEYAVRSYNGYMRIGEVGWSPYSPWQSIATSSSTANVPPIPETPAASHLTCNTATLAWTVPGAAVLRTTPAINRYVVQYYPTATPSQTTQFSLTEGFSAGYPFNTTITGLHAGTDYMFSYAAANTEGTGPSTNTSFRTSPCAPGAPGSISTTAFTNTTVDLSFTAARANGQPVLNYIANLATAGSSVALTYQTAALGGSGDALTLTLGLPPVAALAPATTYQLNLVAQNSLGPGPASSSINFTTASRPSRPSRPSSRRP